MWWYHILYCLYRYTFVIKCIVHALHFIYMLSVIAIKLSLQTFILPQIKILKYHWSKSYCIKPYQYIMLITDMNLAYSPPPTFHTVTNMIYWPDIKSINIPISHKKISTRSLVIDATIVTASTCNKTVNLVLFSVLLIVKNKLQVFSKASDFKYSKIRSSLQGSCHKKWKSISQLR